jgi:hypothetical protein
MKSRGISACEVANYLNCTLKEIDTRLSNPSTILLSDALHMQEVLFKGIPLEDLFTPEDELISRTQKVQEKIIAQARVFDALRRRENV